MLRLAFWSLSSLLFLQGGNAFQLPGPDRANRISNGRVVTTTSSSSSALIVRASYKNDDSWMSTTAGNNYSSLVTTSRAQFVSTCSAAALGLSLLSLTTKAASAFEGGVGGLGKTKPETGVQLFSEESAPVQNAAGYVTAELKIDNQPVLVNFQTPWPLLPTTQGLEARDLQQPESAFVQVVSGDNVPKEMPLNKAAIKKILLNSVFTQQGKFGAYAAPTDVRVQTTADPSVFSVTFTTFTPGLRESDRQVLVKYRPVGSSLVLLITGTTNLRFKKQEKVLQKVVDSFNAVAAPSSRLR